MAAQTYKRTVSGSVGAGMKSLFAGDERRFYTLEHKVSSKYHKAGESQQIIVDQIELGRDPSCQVRFDESFNTVSRKHAAIVKDGDNWKLVQLSQTNSTYLNGHKIANEWYLQNGDEIQLSTNGPKLGFIVSQGEKGMVKSIGFTARLNLFRQQALRPYKRAVTAISCVFVVAVLALSYFLYANSVETNVIRGKLNTAQNLVDSLEEVSNSILADNERLNRKIRDLSGRMDQISTSPSTTVDASGINNAAIEKCLPHVFFIYTVGFEITQPDGSFARVACGSGDVPNWIGTGFLLSDGRFVTARHVAEAWYFWQDASGTNEMLMLLNAIANNGGKVVAHFAAVSSSGKQITFTSEQFVCDRSNDSSGTLEDGRLLTLASLNANDYAYFKTSERNGLRFDAAKSRNLDRGTRLTVLGFPLGLGANAEDDINPIYGNAIVSVQGLDRSGGVILTTDTNYEQGNSGGPVFYTDENGDLVVIGIVSAGAGRSTGFVVPISVIYQ